MYTVVYKIEIDATSHKDAALGVEHIMKTPAYRPFLEVTDKNGKTKEIDLELE